MSRSSPTPVHAAVIVACLLAPIPETLAQQPAAPVARPADKPPIAHGWIDIATFSSPGMPSGMAGMMMGGMGGGGGAGNTPLSALMGGGANAGNQFGLTRVGGAGSYVDVTLRTSRNPTLAEAVQTVPAGTRLAPTLQLKVLPQAKPAPPGDETPDEPGEPPKAKVKLYWGCGTTIRPGQPKTVDFSTATLAQLGEVFKGRRATQRGTHSAAGRPVWPNLEDTRRVPAGASFAGAHAFTGEGVPEGFRFTLPAAQDIMPPIALQQTVADGVTQLTWQVLPTARAYFITAMGGRGDNSGGAEMTLWTSSEVPDSGLGLVDYQTNKSVDQWLKEKVLLAPTTTRCDVPRGIFGEGENAGAMLRMIAYGTELNLAHPPRPTDPTIAWEPDWALKVRVKSVASSMLGMPAMDGGGMGGTADDAGAAEPTATDGDGATPAEEQPKKKKKFSLKDAVDAVKQSVPLPH
ncbi:MAG TPA: hypothetical protein VFI92_09710 [Steroidobacteraceae bacterium]|nr:hypothetical protein [Steroidobacteraceae bacterium]